MNCCVDGPASPRAINAFPRFQTGLEVSDGVDGGAGCLRIAQIMDAVSAAGQWWSRVLELPECP